MAAILTPMCTSRLSAVMIALLRIRRGCGSRGLADSTCRLLTIFRGPAMVGFGWLFFLPTLR